MTDHSAERVATIELPPASAEGLRVRIAPVLGAKVTSLRLPGGREWLAPAVRPLSSPTRRGQAWAELDCSGWDECFPNIAASARLGLLDHGEVWRHPWSTQDTDASLRSQISTDRYSLARELQIHRRRLVAEYTLRSEAPAGNGGTLRWAWAQHPLLAVDDLTRLLLPSPARVRLEAAFVDGDAVDNAEWLCPAGVLGTDTLLGGARGRAAKLWFERPLPPLIAVLHNDEWLVWRTADSSTPDLGLWINLGGWGGSSDNPLQHLAVEPAFGSADDPELAYEQGSGQRLGAGEQRRWRVVIEAGRGLSELAKLFDRPIIPN